VALGFNKPPVPSTEPAPAPPMDIGALLGGVQDITPDKARAEIVKELMQEKNLSRVTDLTDYDIAMLSAIEGINTEMKSSVVKEFTRHFKELKISRNRLGRTEVVDLSKNQEPQMQMQKPPWKFW